MPALHPFSATQAAAHLDHDPAHVRTDHRQIFLELLLNLVEFDLATALRAARWQFGQNGLVKMRRPWTMAVAAVGTSRSTSGSFRLGPRRALPERSCLSLCGSLRLCESTLEHDHSLPKPPNLCTQLAVFSLQKLAARAFGVRRICAGHFGDVNRIWPNQLGNARSGYYK